MKLFGRQLSNFFLESGQEKWGQGVRLLDTLSGTARKVVCSPKNTQYLLDQGEGSQMLPIVPTIFLTAQFHTVLRTPNAGEQKPSQSGNHATLGEVGATSIPVKENVRCGLE